MDPTLDDFDKFVRVLARFSVAGLVVHLTAAPGKVTNEHGAEAVARMLRDAGLPENLMDEQLSQRLLRLGGRDRFAMVWDAEIKEACKPLPPELLVLAAGRFTAARAWRQAMY